MDALLKKLNHRPGVPASVLDAPAELGPVLEAWSAETEVRRRLAEEEGFVLAFVRSSSEVAEWAPQLVEAMVDDGVLWLAYPKKSSKRYSSDISRDEGWQPLRQAGFEPVRQVAVDADWSALRFRRTEHVARKGPSPGPADPPEVTDFLAALPDDRRATLTRVHQVIRAAAPQLKPEVAGGMLGYGPFHYRYATGREGDTYVVSLASQKRHVSLYLCATVDGPYLAEANASRLGNVSVGKSCVRFKRVDDLDLDVVAELVRTAAANPAGLDA